MPIAKPAKPIKPIVAKPVIARPNIVVGKPAPKNTPLRVGPFMSAPGAAWANPAQRPPTATSSPWAQVAPPPTATRTPIGYGQRDAPGIFPTIPTVPGPAAPPPGWGPSGEALDKFLRVFGLK